MDPPVIVSWATVAICALSIAGVLVRPWGLPEWIWAVAGASLLTLPGLISLADAGAAVAKGADVYLFLTGMMLLAELARREGVFDWVAAHAVTAAHGSRLRLFALVYGVGIVVTVVLSNDATAVVLTPAVAAAARKARAAPLPYLLACAFVANAASFVLPVSNPANLVVFARNVPPLWRWLDTFALPSLLAVGVTFVALRFVCAPDLRGAMTSDVDVPKLGENGVAVLIAIGVTALALLVASALNAPLGATTFACSALLLVVASVRERTIFTGVVRAVSWTVLYLVAGLFVVVRGLEDAGLLTVMHRAIDALAQWPVPLGALAAAAATSLAANLMNNLPAGLIAGASAAGLRGHESIHAAIALGIDLGPNLSVTGSLATLLWLVALRRERIEVSAWTFFRAGMLVMPPALLLAVLGTLPSAAR